MSSDRLVMMANQIGKFFVPQKQVEPVGAIATHIRKFWDPRMKRRLFDLVDSGASDFEPVALAAAGRGAAHSRRKGAVARGKEYAQPRCDTAARRNR